MYLQMMLKKLFRMMLKMFCKEECY
jgi:hypothetical protein